MIGMFLRECAHAIPSMRSSVMRLLSTRTGLMTYIEAMSASLVFAPFSLENLWQQFIMVKCISF
jgi:hypothetical protein